MAVSYTNPVFNNLLLLICSKDAFSRGELGLFGFLTRVVTGKGFGAGFLFGRVMGGDTLSRIRKSLEMHIKINFLSLSYCCYGRIG